MDATIAISRNGLTAADKRQSVISHNLANVSTDGFRARMVDQVTLYDRGTHVSQIRQNLTDYGPPRQTGQFTDFYVEGDGFFQVQLADGVGYTRNGAFHFDADGNLRAPTGHLVVPNIARPDDSIGLRTTSDGTIYNVTSNGEQQEIGQLEIARFINPNGLEAVGENLFVETVDSGDAELGTPGEDGFGRVFERMVEGSNVDPSTELTDLLVNQRYHQFNLRVFQTTDSLLGRAVDLFS